MLDVCEGCGALFPPYVGPTHRYLGASPACWALFNSMATLQDSVATDLLAASRVPDNPVALPEPRSPVPDPQSSLDALFGDAYGVQHHGEESPQAIQSVAVHLLNVHGMITSKTTRPGWALTRALRKKGVFHKLTPPTLGGALTIRHLFPGGGVVTPATRTQYVRSVYEAWMAVHGATVEQWYERYVVPD